MKQETLPNLSKLSMTDEYNVHRAFERLEWDKANLMDALKKIANHEGQDFEIGVARHTIFSMREIARAAIANK